MTVGAVTAPLARRRAGVPGAIVAAIALAWALALAAEGASSSLLGSGLASGGGGAASTGTSAIAFFCPLHLAGAVGGGARFGWFHTRSVSFWLAFGLFLVAWQVMIAATMLPSSLPLVRLFARASVTAPGRGRAMAGFFAGYALVWTVFGAGAFAADAFLHRLIASDTVLRTRQRWLAGGLLALAGAFQFTPLKDRCLTQCRHPAAFLLRHYRRGVRGGFVLGRRHGLFCLGCCWALMLVMFGAGLASLVWMALLTVLMTYEKTGRGGRRAARVAGIALLAAGLITIAHPAWLPPLVSGGNG